MTTTLKLFSTSSCHLCQDATDILLNLAQRDFANHNFTWDEIEISEDDFLLNNYGTRIPVLLDCHSGRELNWPFTAKDVIQLITNSSS